ncbi:MAG: DUF1501 domain-containing protein [Planctomycetia bacterium]|nr:DUF1501 domain-containing protein [Planctomycetia bacterium]
MPHTLALRALGRGSSPPGAGFGRAKSCIVFFCWGGVSQLETWDPKPEAPAEVRGSYKPIATAVTDLCLGEWLPLLAKQTQRLALVRSVHHKETGHRNAAYWNLTGHAPHTPGDDSALAPSRRDWPCLGAMMARFRSARQPGFPGAVTLPYQLADRGMLNGQSGGFLGMQHDPLVMEPAAGKPYEGKSPQNGRADLRLPTGVSPDRMQGRLDLLNKVDGDAVVRHGSFDHYRQVATDLLLSAQASAAFDLAREPTRLRNQYGDHVCGQSALLARRLTEAGVPIVTIYPGAGDLNGSQGDNWDTHIEHFPRLRDRLLPPLDRASAALLDDLAARGRLDETLVVWLTEFGRTPRINGASSRDHHPQCYSVAFAGGGIRGGFVYGRSDAHAARPAAQACGPSDLHATIFHALGIPADAHLSDALNRPIALTDGAPLPLFT